jgi:hypothetical protein
VLILGELINILSVHVMFDTKPIFPCLLLPVEELRIDIECLPILRSHSHFEFINFLSLIDPLVECKMCEELIEVSQSSIDHLHHASIFLELSRSDTRDFCDFFKYIGRHFLCIMEQSHEIFFVVYEIYSW